MCRPKKRPRAIPLAVGFKSAESPIPHRCWICGDSVEPNEKQHDGCLEIYNRILKKREEILNLEWKIFKYRHTVYDDHNTR